MPRRTTALRRRSDTSAITPHKAQYCLTGYVAGLPGDTNPFGDNAVCRDFWNEHRELLLKWFIETGVPDELHVWGFDMPCDIGPFAGRRPWAWWAWDAPEKRRRMIAVRTWKERGDGFCDFFNRAPTAADLAVWESGEISFGIPHCRALCIFETEADYLARHGLLTLPEKQLIEAANQGSAHAH